MNEFAEIAKLLDSLGVKAIFAPILSILILLFLMKKYIFSGGAVFMKEAIKEWLADQREKIRAELSIWEKLKDIDDKFTIMQEALWDSRRFIEVQNKAFEEMLRQHVAETRTLILILKKKTESVEEPFKVDTQYFKGGSTNVANTTTS